MRVAIIYRPKHPAPFEALPMLMEGLGQWVETYSKRCSTLEFFAVGGGLVIADLDASADVQRIVAENPFTAFMDVEILPVLEPAVAMETYGEIAATLAGAAAPPA